MAQLVATPATGVVPDGFKVLREGQASVLLKGNEVFYNEAQVTNRDLSIAVLRCFLPQLEKEHADGNYAKQAKDQDRLLKRRQRQQQNEAATDLEEQEADEVQQGPGGTAAQPENAPMETDPQPGSGQRSRGWKGARVLEGLAATGLRSIRYALEVPGISQIDSNDLDPSVVVSMRRNVAFNGEAVAKRIRCLTGDARLVMMQAPKTYDVIDLDPYGTPSMLLDSAVQSVADGGLLLITATDMANLCGNMNISCWSNYGSYPLHKSYCHEQALRILLGCVETHANRYKRHIKPLLSVSVDFYIRIFVRVFTSASEVKNAPCKQAYVWQSSGCDSFWMQRVGETKVKGNSIKFGPGHGPAVPDIKCPDTGSGYTMGGPMWAEPIHDQAFVASVMASMDKDKSRFAQYTRIRGLLASVYEELPDAPLYYDLHDVCKSAKVVPMKTELFFSALINAGYRVSGSHTGPLAIKTDAPPEVIWDIVRCWVKEHPVNIKDKTSFAAKIQAKEPKLQASFVRATAALQKTDASRRFVQNPPNWGPKSRHGRPPVEKPGSKQAAAPQAGVKEAAVVQDVGQDSEVQKVEQAEAPQAEGMQTAVVQDVGQGSKVEQMAGELAHTAAAVGTDGQGAEDADQAAKRQRVE